MNFNLIKTFPEIDYKNLTPLSIINLRKNGYDPYEILAKLAVLYNWNPLILDIYRKIGAGYSPWIQLAFFVISAVYS